MPDLRLRLNRDMLTVAPLLTWSLLDPDVDESECLEYLNILDDELVSEIYRRFKMAGAQCVCTNTRKANRLLLRKHGFEDALEEINRLGVQLAREAKFEHVFAALEVAEQEVMEEQLTYLLSETPDALLLVSTADDSLLPQALETTRALTELPILAAASAQHSCPPADIVYSMGLSLQESLDEVKLLAKKCPQPLMVCPDPGTAEAASSWQKQRNLVQLTDELEKFALDARNLGVQFIGVTPGSSPVMVGAISTVTSGSDVLARHLT